MSRADLATERPACVVMRDGHGDTYACELPAHADRTKRDFVRKVFQDFASRMPWDDGERFAVTIVAEGDPGAARLMATAFPWCFTVEVQS